MKKIHISKSKLLTESNYYEAGTDHPLFHDEKNDEWYEAHWNTDYGYPFGYWPINNNNDMMFCIAEPYETHCQACGIAAEKYVKANLAEGIEEEADDIQIGLKNLKYDFEEYGYVYNEDSGNYISQDGTLERDEYDFAEEIYDNIYGCIDSRDYIQSLVEDFLENGNIPSVENIKKYLWDMIGEFDFSTQSGIDAALNNSVGMTFNQFFEMGENEGRIWPNKEMIGFYVTEQPDPERLMNILYDLAENNPHDSITVEEMLQYTMVFEDWRSDGEVTACTLSDYIDGNYGPESYEEDDEPTQYARDGKTVFVPHLANQDQKREFFKDFRNTRDRAVYTPREKGAGTLARYHALRYPFGESKKPSSRKVYLNESAIKMLKLNKIEKRKD